MRGFVIGSLLLIALEAVIRNADNAGKALTGSQDLVRRLLSAEVAAVPDFPARKAAAEAAAAKKKPASSSSTVPLIDRGLAPIRPPVAQTA